MDRYGRLTLEKDPAHGLVLHSTDRAGARGGAAAQEDPAAARRAPRRLDRRWCTRASAATSSRSCSRSAGRPRTSPATSTARRTRSRCDEAEWYAAALPAAGGRRASGTAAPASSCCPAAPARRSSAPAPWPRPQATTLILVTNTVSRAAVAGRAAAADHADRGRDRRVLRCPQGDPPGHDRDLPGADDQAEGRLHPPRPARRPRLGPHPLRRGAPAARADLPHDGRPAGPPAPRPHRDPGARGRARGRRLQPHRAQAVRRAVEGHRGPGLHRAGRLRRGAGHPAGRRADDLRDGRAGGPLPARARTSDSKNAVVEALVEKHAASRPW